MSLLVGVFIGLMLGWCLIPQPKWAQALWDKFIGYIKPHVTKVNLKVNDISKEK